MPHLLCFLIRSILILSTSSYIEAVAETKQCINSQENHTHFSKHVWQWDGKFWVPSSRSLSQSLPNGRLECGKEKKGRVWQFNCWPADRVEGCWTLDEVTIWRSAGKAENPLWTLGILKIGMVCKLFLEKTTWKPIWWKFACYSCQKQLKAFLFQIINLNQSNTNLLCNCCTFSQSRSSLTLLTVILRGLEKRKTKKQPKPHIPQINPYLKLLSSSLLCGSFKPTVTS